MSFFLKCFFKLYSGFIKIFGLRNYILFESSPDFSDNTLYVFNELVKRGVNKKNKLIWVLNSDENLDTNKFSGVRNVKIISRNSKKFKCFYSFTAKLLICCNNFLLKRNKKQKAVFLGHGAAIKDVRGKYELPEAYSEDKGITLSYYTAEYDSKTLNAPSDFMIPLGYPRNDILFNKKIDLESLFKVKADKFIYWLPTFRQHKSVEGRKCSSIAIPIIHNEDNALRINEYAKSKNAVIILKPHPAQDLSYIKKLDLSNILFIDNSYLTERNTDNYSILGSCDALLTDYSSVFYDYMLVNKPIGLCWEDIDEYKQLEGLIFNDEELEKVTDGFFKIYTCDDFETFINEIVSGEDSFKQKREETRNLIHKYADNNSTTRVCDYIEHLL